MTNFAWWLLAIYSVLLIAWFLLGEYERKTRSDSSAIPRYLITDVGNTVGLTLAFLAALPLLEQTPYWAFVICYIAGLLICLRLHLFWRRRSKEKTIGQYQDGSVTSAGRVHFLFMWLVCGSTLTMLFSGAVFTTYSLTLFGLATIVYWGSFGVDCFYRRVL